MYNLVERFIDLEAAVGDEEEEEEEEEEGLGKFFTTCCTLLLTLRARQLYCGWHRGRGRRGWRETAGLYGWKWFEHGRTPRANSQ